MPTDAVRVETIFQAAIEIADAAARSNYLDEACAGDAALKARILSLLKAHDHPDSLLDQPVVSAPDPVLAATRLYENLDETRAMPEPSEESDDEPVSFLAPSSRPDSLGKIGQYEVLEILGRGGFGIVFRAFDERLQRVVAVKVLAPSLATTSPARKRFLREARSSAAVRHENVVQVHAVEEQPLPHLVMEFVPGETLQGRLDRTGPLDTAEVLKIGRQIAEGLAAAHATGLIHRDIKPSNILVFGEANPVVKITDFGLARAADDASLTRSGVVAGTPMYMAPEQAKGEPLDHSADLFSLGSVLYVLASGRPPFRASSTLAVLKRVADETPRPIREIIPEVPEWLCRIIEKLHAKDPAERYQSSREVAETLADCEEQLKAQGAVRDFSRIPGGGPKTRNPAPRKAAFVVLALSLAYVAFFAYQNRIKPYFNGSATDPNTGRLIVEVRESGRLRLEVFKTGEPDTKSVFEHGALGIPFDRRVPVGNWNVVAYYEGVASPFQAKFDLGPDGRTIVVPAFEGPPPPPTALADGWVSLFNGKDLTGWNLAGSWTVQNGILTGTADRPGTIYTKIDDYANFHLRAEVRVNAGGEAGVWFRHDPAISNVGYKATLRGDPDDWQPTGSLHVAPGNGKIGYIRKAEKGLTKPDEWFTLEVIADGTSVTVKVDGSVSAALTDWAHTRGRFGLEVAGTATKVEFRKVEIRTLTAGTTSNAAIPRSNTGAPLDLMPFAKITPGYGDWTRTGQTITLGVPKSNTQLFWLPFDVKLPREYVLEAEIERLDGTEAIGLGMSAFGKKFAVSLDTWPSKGFISGLYRIDGQGPDVNPTGIRGALLANGRKQLLRCTVRESGVAASLDGVSLFHYRGGIENLKPDQPAAPGASCQIESIAPMRLHSFVLKPIADAGPNEAPVGWTPVLNGKDLAGWKAHPQPTQKSWKVENGILTGSGAASYFYSPAQYANFNLKAEFQVNKAGNGGIFLRSTFPTATEGSNPKGYEVQIIGPEAAPSNYQTGGLVNFTDAKGMRIDADTWYTLEIIAHGPNMSVMLNGVTISNVKDEKNAFVRGHIALQLGDAGTTVRFRKLEILQLPSDPPAGTAPDPDVVKALEAKIAAVESTLANVRASYKEMRVPRAAVIGAESAVIEAKIKLAEEWKRHDEVVKLAGEAVTKQEELRGMMNEQVKAGVLPKSTLDAIDSTIADAKLRLAKAKQNRPETKP